MNACIYVVWSFVKHDFDIDIKTVQKINCNRVTKKTNKQKTKTIKMKSLKIKLIGRSN